MKIVILGAGIAGISTAYHALKKGYKNIKVFEKSSRIGGLLDNFEVSGFKFDYAVHLSFTKNDYVKKMFEKTPHYKHKPLAYNYAEGDWIKHPVQNNLFPLTLGEKVAAIESFINKPCFQSGNYEEWLISQYGQYLAEKYPIRYTRKYWATDANKLSVEWVSNRFSKLDLTKILEGAITNETPNYYYADEMRYPQKGGFKSFIQPMIDVIEPYIFRDKNVIAINEIEKWVRFEDGELEFYDVLISSIPLPQLANISENIPASLQEVAKDLYATSVALVSLGFKKPDIPKYLWFYIYDEDILAARAYSPSMKSSNNVPFGCSSLQFEVYFNNNFVKYDEKLIVDNIINSLIKMGVAEKEDIIVSDYREIEYGNVVFFEGMLEKRKLLKDYFEKKGISLIGRFGEWDYFWSDQSLLSGKNAIEKIKGEM